MTLKIGENITSNTSLDSEKNSSVKFIDRNLPANSDLQNQTATANITNRLIENSKGNPNRELTAQDFLQKVLKEQPIKIDDQNKSKIRADMKLDKKPSEMTRDDYNIAFRREVYRHAMSGLKMSDDEIRMADKALIDAGIYKTYFNLQGTMENLQNSHERSGNQMPVNIGNENIEYARRAGQAVLQYREYQSLADDAKKEYARRYVNEAFGGFIQPIVNAPVNIGNGLSEPFRAGERAMFGTNYIPEIPRMQVAERSEYWNKDNRMLANRIGEIGATITFGGFTGSRMLATQTGRTILGIESSYNVGAGIAGKDITQQDENGNARQMPFWERGIRIGGGFLGARQTIKTEISTPNSAVNRLDDIFKNPPTIKPQTEMILSNGTKIKVPQIESPKNSNVSEMRLPNMDEQINGNPIKESWKTKLGEGQDVDDLQEVGKVGAGMKAKPQHHVFPQEYRKFFEERGFVGERSIDKFVVTLDDSFHQAIHGGADWKLARKVWKEGEWNNRVMTEIKDAEEIFKRKLTFEEIKARVEQLMKQYDIPIKYGDYRGGVK